MIAMHNEFREVIISGGRKLGLSVSEETVNKYEQYYQKLLEENKKYNLTAITAAAEAAEKHFLDSLLLVEDLQEIYNTNVVDIGSGAGFPGLPLKIYLPGLKMTLLDAVGKKVLFLQQVINILELYNVVAVHARVEEFAANHRESYHVAISRAVAELRVLVEYALPLVQVGGMFIASKGPAINEELRAAEQAIEILGGRLEKVREIALPLSKERRSIVIIKKISDTPAKYPRRAGIPKKRPL